ncbi:hypothetical protein MPSEU_000002800 [Mayamaea pseudoterrestris]|nr:hypothetical protein MPSEU_000002800 [Mayamaea pseudoterrestris]
MTVSGQRCRCRSLFLLHAISLVLIDKSLLRISANEAFCHADGTCETNGDSDPLSSRLDQAMAAKSTAYGLEQYITHDFRREQQLRLMEQVDQYMRNIVFTELKYIPIKADCLNRHDLCSFWSAIGECKSNEAYMLLQCAPACQACHSLIFEERCPFDENDLLNVWQPGDLGSFFRRITTDESIQQSYNPQILSQPERGGVHGDNPWIIILDDFLTQEECETLIEQGAIQGYERSEDVGRKRFDGTYDSIQSEGRTSTNAWCLNDCYEHNVTRAVTQRMEELTGVPESHSEYLQLLKYEPGQFYEMHHDYIPHHVQRAQGPRILTIFLYLNDVEEGGGTRFTDLDLTIMPKRGRAVIWPSVLDQAPTLKEPRTHHEALPVTKGVKYGANAWIHLRDFKKPYIDSCV